MQDGNPFGIKDHTPFSGFSAELVYGLREDGTVVHVSETVSGLKCGCRCPACERPVVAKKGKKQAHHFAHHAGNVACSKAVETNAHIWAKAVLDREKRIKIPKVVAEHEGQRVTVSHERVFTFASARLEKRLDTIVPDVVLVTDTGVELIVEVRVTHACDDRKIDKLRAANLSAIEIDLSRFRTCTDREAVEAALLSGSGRIWLNNAKKLSFDEQLARRIKAEQEQAAAEAAEKARRDAVERAAKERKEQARIRLATDRIVRAARASGERVSDPEIDVDRIINDFPDVPWTDGHTIGFNVADNVWQAELARMLLSYPAACTYASEGFTMGYLWAILLPRVMPEFRGSIPAAVYTHLEKAFPGKFDPKQAIEAFILDLVKTGYVHGYAHQFSEDDHFYVSRNYADDLHEGVQRQKAYNKRRVDVSTKVTAIIDKLPNAEKSSFSLDRWFATPLPLLPYSPDLWCRREANTWPCPFEKALTQIEAMCEGQGPPVEDMLGLPLERAVERAQARVRNDKIREAQYRRQRLSEAAEQALGEDAAAWLRTPSEGDDPLRHIDVAGLDDPSLWRMQAELEKAVREREARQRAHQKVVALQGELREAAHEVWPEDRAELFLKSYQPRFDTSPIGHCVDQHTLKECLALLPPIQRKRRAR